MRRWCLPSAGYYESNGPGARVARALCFDWDAWVYDRSMSMRASCSARGQRIASIQEGTNEEQSARTTRSPAAAEAESTHQRPNPNTFTATPESIGCRRLRVHATSQLNQPDLSP